MVATTYYPFFFASLVVLYITSEETSSFSTLITFDVDGTLVSSSPGWEEGAHARSFTHAVNSILVKSNDDDDDASASPSTIPQLLEKHEYHGSTDGLILMRLARKMMGATFDKTEASSKLDLMMDAMYRFVSNCTDDEVRRGIAPLPGTIETLKSLASYEDVAFGLVTGNVEGIARRKMHALGILDTGALTSVKQPPRLGERVWEGMEEKRFVGGFGSDFCSGDIDNPERNYLDRGEQLAICVQKLNLFHNNSHITRVIHVGDAPADILAAKSYAFQNKSKPKNCSVGVIGVATGSYSVEELRVLCGERIPGVWEPVVLEDGIGVGNREAFIKACRL
jgi:phosphoglycolate phosphatase-like HAD superfamily hydrolase